MTTKKIIAPTQYKACVIAPAPAGFDVFDSDGRWFNVKTQKQAKWWAAIHTRLESEFKWQVSKPAPRPVDDHTPVVKEK
jgi:hypothetical protein